jgi:hypothetical protein
VNVFLFSVLSGLHEGARLELPQGSYSIGSQPEVEIAISDLPAEEGWVLHLPPRGGSLYFESSLGNHRFDFNDNGEIEIAGVLFGVQLIQADESEPLPSPEAISSSTAGVASNTMNISDQAPSDSAAGGASTQLSAPVAASPSNSLKRLIARTFSLSVVLLIVGLIIALGIGAAVASWYWNKAGAPAAMANVSQMQDALNSNGHWGVKVNASSSGKPILTGFVQDDVQAKLLTAKLQEFGVSSVTEEMENIVVLDQLGQQIGQIFSAPSLRLMGMPDGRIEVRGLSDAPESYRQIVRLLNSGGYRVVGFDGSLNTQLGEPPPPKKTGNDVRAQRTIVLNGGLEIEAKPTQPEPPPSPFEGKVTKVQFISPAYVEIDHANRYYRGSKLPSGFVVTEISVGRIILDKGNQRVEYQFAVRE